MARHGVKEENLPEEVRWNPELFNKEIEKWQMIEESKAKARK